MAEKAYERLFKDGSVNMKLCRGKVHYYLGIHLDYTIKGEVKITIIPYIKEMIKDFREYDPSPNKKANTPAAEFLFKADDESRLFYDSRAKELHTYCPGHETVVFLLMILFVTQESYGFSSNPIVIRSPTNFC